MSDRMRLWLERFDTYLSTERRFARLTRQHCQALRDRVVPWISNISFESTTLGTGSRMRA